MKILTSDKLLEDLKNTTLFLDTNTLIAAMHYDDIFGKLLLELKSNGCALMIIPSVYFEFTRGVDSIESYNKRTDFIEAIVGKGIYPIERHLDDMEDFIVVSQHISGSISYTDFLLLACLYKFPGAYLMTENYKHVSSSIFDRKHVITIDTGKDIRNHGVYNLSAEKYSKAATKILKGAEILKDEIPF